MPPSSKPCFVTIQINTALKLITDEKTGKIGFVTIQINTALKRNIKI